MEEESKSRSPILVAVAGLVLPGLGYVLVGERKRGLIVGLTLLLMFLAGILIAGIRVFEVPGYGYDQHDPPRYGKLYLDYYSTRGGLYAKYTTKPGENSQWLLVANFRGEIANRVWFVPQALMGVPTAVASYFSISAGEADVPQSHARLAEIGTLYTAVAGMLNLLAVIDAASRCPKKEES